MRWNRYDYLLLRELNREKMRSKGPLEGVKKWLTSEQDRWRGLRWGGIENREKDTIIKGKWWVRAKGEVGQKESVKESADNDTYLSHYAEGLFFKGRTEIDTVDERNNN